MCLTPSIQADSFKQSVAEFRPRISPDKATQKKSVVIHLKLFHLIKFNCVTMGNPNTLEKTNSKCILENCNQLTAEQTLK